MFSNICIPLGRQKSPFKIVPRGQNVLIPRSALLGSANLGKVGNCTAMQRGAFKTARSSCPRRATHVRLWGRKAALIQLEKHPPKRTLQLCNEQYIRERAKGNGA